MSLRCRERIVWALGLCTAAGLVLVAAVSSLGSAPAPPKGAPATTMPGDGLGVPGVLRVAADPNDLPFSNEKLEGFENKLAALVAKDLGVKVEYTWRAQRRGFVRETIKAGECDVMMGVPTSLDMTQPTVPYYRSTYAFVVRTKDGKVASLDDPRLKTMKIGIPLPGESPTPAGYALARRGIIENISGFSLYADYAQPNPTSRIIEAVGDGRIDVAIVWGPLAGFFAPLQTEPLTVFALPEAADEGIPFAFNVSMGVKRGNAALKARLDEIITKRRGDIEKLLDDYHVPRLEIPAKPAAKTTPTAAAPDTTGDKPCNCD